MIKRKQFILASIVVILMMAVLPLNALAKSKIIPNNNKGIPDKVLYQVILRKLNKSGKAFTEEEAAKIRHLRFDGSKGSYKITSLTGLNKLINLRTLDVYGNNLRSLSGIEGLSKLEELEVSNNKLKNLSGVENLFNITSITAIGNQLDSIKSVRTLPRLKNLEVGGNKLRNLNGIEGLPGLEWLYAGGNRLTRLPDLKKIPNLSFVEFKWNCLSKKELKDKLPSGWKKIDDWFKSTVKLQNIVYKIELDQPESFSKINKNTRKISGIANKNSTVSIRDPKGKKIVSVKTDSKGKFIFRNLNLEKWTGMTLILQSYVMDKFYGEKNILKEVKFMVHN